MKDSLIVEKAAENSESIINIEAELEAKIERLGINMNTSNTETRLSDTIDICRAGPEMKQELLGFISLEEQDEENSDNESEVEKQLIKQTAEKKKKKKDLLILC